MGDCGAAGASPRSKFLLAFLSDSLRLIASTTHTLVPELMPKTTLSSPIPAIRLRFTPAVLSAVLLASPGHAQELFRDAMTDGAAWQNLNTASTDSLVTYGYDYTADFIPEAPNTRPGDAATTGVKAQANIAVRNDAADVVALSPLGQTFAGNYRLRFDAWINYDLNAYFNLNRSGTSEAIGASIRADPTAFDPFPANGFPQYRTNAYTLARGDGDLYYWRSNDDSPETETTWFSQGDSLYYAEFLPPVSAPGGQQTDYGPTAAGAVGFQWLTFEYQAVGDIAMVIIEKPNGERLPIVRIDESAEPSTGDSFVLLYDDDFYLSIAPQPELQFGLFDNVVVEALMPGDYNTSGQVEQGDLDLVLQNWGTDTTLNIPAGWINVLGLAGIVDQAELDGVLQNWGGTAAPDFGGFVVPEPTLAPTFLLWSLVATRRRVR